jgi:hypothetical protein
MFDIRCQGARLDAYGMSPALEAEHDLGDTIPEGGYPEPAISTMWSRPIPKPPRTWTWGGEVMGT